jgi:O-acetyl-ADP-ribose deacetylase (regulator of RNase III)
MVIEVLTDNIINSWQNDSSHSDLVQGCNIYASMSGGLAYSIARKYPDNILVDAKQANVPGTFTYYKHSNSKGIINAYTQALPGGLRQRGQVKDGVYYSDNKSARLEYIRQALIAIRDTIKSRTLYIPKIGAGIAGGDWEDIREIIKDTFEDTQFFVKIAYWSKEWTQTEFSKYTNI